MDVSAKFKQNDPNFNKQWHLANTCNIGSSKAPLNPNPDPAARRLQTSVRLQGQFCLKSSSGLCCSATI
jgi:hypothetical protein